MPERHDTVLETSEQPQPSAGVPLKPFTRLVLHIPHSSPDERKSLIPSDDALRHELLRMTDAHTDSLFAPTPFEADRVAFPASRLICDVERFPDDVDEPMVARGMGAVYVAMSDGTELHRNLGFAERSRVMTRWYHPHHAALTSAVDRVIADGHSCIVVDCHSFSSRPLPHEPDQEADRPDICVGTDPFHTPTGIESAVVTAASAAGLSTLITAHSGAPWCRPSTIGRTRVCLPS